MLKKKDNKKEFESIAQKIPWRSRILTKFTVLIFCLAIIPLLLINFFLFNSYKTSLKQQVTEDLLILAEAKEGHLFSYMNTIMTRVVDFSSDGFIRDAVQETINDPDNTEIIEQLSQHLKVNKLPLSEEMYGINIVGLDGVVLASTSNLEIGKDESKDNYFIYALDRPYGKAFMSKEVSLGYHFDINEPSLTVSAPLTNKITGETIGVIITHYSSSHLDDVLTGEQQVRLGAISGDQGAKKTLNIYIVNSDKKIITKSRLSGKSNILKKEVNTKPVRACLESQEEINGEWFNHNNTLVYGSSMCILNHGHNWTVLVEIDEEEVLQPVYALRKIAIAVVLLNMLLVILLGTYFLRRLTRPIEVLTDTSRKISGGDLKIRAKVYSKDEVGQLAQSFNQMTESLIQISEESQSIVRILPDALFILNKKGEVTAANPQAQKIMNQPDQNLYTSELVKLFKGRKKSKKISKSPSPKEVTIGRFIYEAFVTEVQGYKHDTIGVIIILHDITRAKAIDKMKTEFISVASHQLRTPMTGIQWVVERFMKKEKLSKKGKEYLHDIHSSMMRLNDLVTALLSVSRIEGQSIGINPKSLELTKFIKTYLEESQALAAKKEVTLIFKKHPKVLNVSTDEPAFNNIIHSLISNAIEYSAGGTAEVSLEKKKNSFVLTVSDTGIGIPKTEQANIFNKFTRGSNATLVKTDGTGLGLYIAKESVRMLGGKIWFDSEQGKGANFYVELPLKSKTIAGKKRLAE